MTAIFGGILQNEVRCLVCGMESKKHDPFLGKETCHSPEKRNEDLLQNRLDQEARIKAEISFCLFSDLSLDIPVHFSSKSAKVQDGESLSVCDLSRMFSGFCHII